MAKRGIIIDAAIPSMEQPWGGVNNGNATINVLGVDIPAGKAWALDFARVEDFVKGQITALQNVKAGSTCWSPTPNGANHYELWGFKDAAAQQQFMTEYSNVAGIETDMDHTIYALRLFVAELPIAATDADTYTVSLSTSRTGSSPASPIVIQRGKSFNIPLRVLAWHYPPNGGNGDAAAYTVQPYIIVERYSGSRWETMDSVPVTGIAGSESDSSFPNIIDVGEYADTGSDGIVQLGFRIAEYTYENSLGETVTMASNRVTVYLQTVTLGISLQDGQWLKSPVGGGNTIAMAFNLQGAVAKVLHVNFLRVDGTTGYSAEREGVTATGAFNYSITDDANNQGVTASGVHTLEAWLTYGSGADMIETPHIIHQILVRQNAQDNTTGPRVLVQQMADSVDNFVQAALCHYIVWNPKLVDGAYINDTTVRVPVRFIVADGPSLTDPSHVEYVTLPVSVTPGEDNTLLATMEVETDVAQDTYSARLHALANDGTAMLTPAVRFSIDNTAGFQPTADSTFHLNPKSRNNSEVTPQTVINARTGEVIQSEWVNFKMDASDGYTTDAKNEKVLLVPAGRKLTIFHNPLAYMHNEPSSTKGLTMAFDLTVSNIVNEDDPILRLCEFAGSDENGDHYLGLRLRPLVGTMGSVTDSNESTTDFRWAEDRRMHLVVTIIPNVKPNVDGDARYHSGMMDDNFDPDGTINLVRIYMNGVIVREMEYNANRINGVTGKGVEFFTGDTVANPGIIIGQEGDAGEGRASGADIFIYGIRVWQRGLTPAEVLQNYISSLPGSDEKRRIKAQNDIMRDDGSGRISLPKACAIGKNCLIWHGVEPMFKDDKKKGWLEIRRYGYDGTYLPQYSGSFCKATKKLSGKGQGTTAMTYCYWNIQWKYGDIGYDDDGQLTPSGCLVLTPEQVNTDIIHLGTPVAMESLDASTQAVFALVDTSVYTHACPVYGGNLGKDEPVGTKPKYYPCTVDETSGTPVVETIMFPDGWVNGSGDLISSQNPRGGQYCGPCWQAGDGLPYSSKHVLKINYASSMQSHLIGINWLYNALHTAYCGRNSMQADSPSAVVAKQVVPVLFFTAGVDDVSENVTNGTANFRGLGGYGPGKMDKPTWGYNKSAPKVAGTRPDGHDYFAMYEGAVNNTTLGDMLAPFDDTDLLDGNGNVIQRAKVKYFLHDPSNPDAKDPESFYYRKTSDSVDPQTGERADNWEKCVGFDGGKTGRSLIDDPQTDADRFNNLLCNANSCDDPSSAPSAKITKVLRNAWNYVYLHNPNIRFFNGTQTQLNSAELTDVQRKRKYITKDSWLLKRWDFCEHRWVDAGLWNTSTHAYDQIDIFAAIGSPQNISDDRQAVVDAYIAYIVAEARPTNNDETDGIGAFFKTKSLRFHYAFQNHFIAGTDNCSKNTYYVIDPVTHLIELHQDDVDTTLATDNYGFQTKPYYVDRMNPYDDKDTVRAEDKSCYDGMQNGLFDLAEAMWADNGTLANTLNGVLIAMAGLNGGIGSAESSDMVGVWRALNRYLFDIQRYFPQSTYNEAARIRYEFPAMTGFVGRNGEAPCLQQSMGDQLEAEIQFMRRRLIYMASYAGYGDFAPTEGQSAGTTGLSDAGAQLTVGGDSPDQTFVLTPHQYIFPVFVNGQTQRRTLHRCAPGVAWSYNPAFSDYMNTIALKGLNYYRSVGNLGDKTVNAASFTISGTRLTEFVAEPTNTAAPPFSLGAAPKIGSATRLRKLSLKGCSTTSSTGTVPLDLTALTLVEEIDLRGTAMQAVTLPETSTLATLRVPRTLTRLSLTAQPLLSTLEIDGSTWAGAVALNSVEITGCPLLATTTYFIVNGLKDVISQMAMLKLSHISWSSSVTLAALRWMLGATVLELKGKAENAGYDFSVNGTPTFDDVCQMISRLGDFRSSENDIYVSVSSADISLAESRLSIGGKKYVNTGELNTDDDGKSYWEKTAAHQRNGLWSAVTEGNNVKAIQLSDGSWVPAVQWDFVTEQGGNVIDNATAPLYAEFKANGVVGGSDACLGINPRMWVKSAGENVKLVVRMRMTLVGDTVLTRTKRIGMWWRTPQVGDFAWSDGEFDDEDDASKVLAGLVVMREWLDENDNVVTDESLRRKYRLWVLASANATIPAVAAQGDFAAQSAITTPAWGLYPANSADGLNPTWDADGGRFSNGLTERIRYFASQWANETGYNYSIDTNYRNSADYPAGDPFDTPLIDYSGSHTMSKANYQDATNSTPACQGSNTGAGDGKGYASQSNSYQRNFNTLAENAILMSYANIVLAAVEDYIHQDENYQTVTLIRPTTPVELARLLQQLVGILGGTIGAAVARQLAFPAIRACNVWSPASVNAQAEVDEQYVSGKWMAPSSGLLARIYNFLGNSRTTYNSTGAPSASLEAYPEREAELPLFANALARATTGRAISISNSSYHWSVTEYSRYNARYVYFYSGGAYYSYKYNTGYVVRAVAAFTFVP